MTEDVESSGDDAEEGAEARAEGEPKRDAGKRRRIGKWLVDGGVAPSGDQDMMVASDPETRHGFFLRAKEFTAAGAPARVLINMAGALVGVLEEMGGRPHIESIARSNSIEMRLFAPELEVSDQRARLELADQARLEGLPSVPAREALEEEAPASTPAELEMDTSKFTTTALAVEAVTRVLSHSDPEGAADHAHALGVGAANKVERLVDSLGQQEVELLVEVADGSRVRATPEWSRRVAKALQDSHLEQSDPVSVLGVLQGANSNGDGHFELVTDERLQVDSRLGAGPPGGVIKGRLTPEVKATIKRENLWDSHVLAKIEVTRRINGESRRIQERRMVAIEPRFDSKAPEE